MGDTMGLEVKSLLTEGLLPWETPKEVIVIKQLPEILGYERKEDIHSLCSIVRVYRLDLNGQRVIDEEQPTNSSLYKPQEEQKLQKRKSR